MVELNRKAFLTNTSEEVQVETMWKNRQHLPKYMTEKRTLLPVGPNRYKGPFPGTDSDAFRFV